MAVNKVDMLQNSTTENTDRGPSPQVWADFPIADIQEDPGVGMHFFDDFLATPNVAAGAEAVYGIYKGFADTGGSVTEVSQAAGAQLGGIKVFSSDGDNEGASLATVSKPFEIDRTNNGKLFAFEARVKTSTIADTKHGFFLGVIDDCTLSATVPIAAAGTLADENFVGFHRLEGDGSHVDVVYKANGVTQVTLLADAVTLVADTWVKLGMRFEPVGPAGSWYVRFFKNNVELTGARYQVVAAQGTDFPNDVGLGLVFAVLNATGTTPGSSSMDWWRACQLFA